MDHYPVEENEPLMHATMWMLIRDSMLVKERRRRSVCHVTPFMWNSRTHRANVVIEWHLWWLCGARGGTGQLSGVVWNENMNVLNITEHVTGSMLNLNKPIHIFHWQKHFYLTFPDPILCNMLNLKNQTTSKYVECLPHTQNHIKNCGKSRDT